MRKYLIDANLPYRFELWSKSEFVHVYDLGDEWSDSEIWTYAKKNNLTIVTKDTDFSDRIVLHKPPPRVIHIRLGNLKMKPFYNYMVGCWNDMSDLSKHYKLVRVYPDRIEGIE